MSLILGMCFVLGGIQPTIAAPQWLPILFSDSLPQESLPPLRRFYVPADRVDELLERYRQMRSVSREDFENLLRRAKQGTEAALPFLDGADFHATFDGSRLRGTARLRMPVRREGSSLLRWPASNWSISSARWAQRDASLGYAGSGQMAVVIPPGEMQTLHLEWSAVGEAIGAAHRFDFQIPPAIRTELTIDLPRGLTPAAPRGLVAQLGSDSDASMVRWRIQWSPCDRIVLSLMREDGPQPFRALVAYERELEADVSVEATDILARFRISVTHQPISQLEFNVPAGVEVYSWSGIKLQDSQMLDGKLQFILAEPLLGTQQITLHALAPGPSGERWQLPRLEIAGGFCVGGSVRLNSVPGLTLTDVRTPPTVQLAPGAMGEKSEWVLQDVRLRDFVVAHTVMTGNSLVTRVRTTLELGSRLQADVTLGWEIAAGETNAVQIRVPTEWSVQAVDGLQGTTVTRWFATVPDHNGSVLTLQLGRTAYTGSSVAAQIRLSGPNIDSSLANTRVIVPRFRPFGGEASDESVIVRSDPAWSAELVDMTQVAPLTRSTLAVATAGAPLQFRFDGPLASAVLSITRRAAEYSSTLDTQVDVTERVTEARYSFDFDWPATQPETVDIGWTASTGDDLRWALPAGVQVVRLAREDGQDGLVESWRVSLPQRAGRRVRLSASWRADSETSVEIPLPTLAQATMSSGSVAIRHAPELLVQSQVIGLVPPTSAPAASSSGPGDERSETWRYGIDSPQLVIGIARNERLLAAMPWVIQASLQSSFAANGAAVHQIEYELRNAAGCEFDLQFPAGTTVGRVSAPGANVTHEAGNLLRVRGPASLDSWSLIVDYSLPARSLGRYGVESILLPELPYAVSHFTWEVEVPAGYVPVSWSRGVTAVPPRLASD